MHFRISQLNFYHPANLMIKNGEYDQLREFLIEKLQVIETQAIENHFMHIACRFASNEMLDIVIELLGKERAKHFAGYAIGGGWTPLHLAVSYGDAKMVQTLVDVLGDDVPRIMQSPLHDTSEALPLHLAVYAANTEVVKVLLNAAGKTIHKFSKKLLGNEWTFIHLATYCGDADMVAAVIRAIGNKTARELAAIKLNNSMTILHLAAASRDDEIGDLIMDVVGEELGYELAQVRVPELNNFLPLHSAVQYGLTRMVQRLLFVLKEKAADLCQKQLIDGWSAFDQVAYQGDLEMLEAMIAVLGDRAAEIIMRPFIGMFQATPFHMVINRGNVAMTKAMIAAVDRAQYPALLNLKQSDGTMPIHLAKRFYNDNILNVLIEVGAR